MSTGYTGSPHSIKRYESAKKICLNCLINVPRDLEDRMNDSSEPFYRALVLEGLSIIIRGTTCDVCERKETCAVVEHFQS